MDKASWAFGKKGVSLITTLKNNQNRISVDLFESFLTFRKIE